MSVEVGQAAPEFTLTNQYGQQVSLSDYRGEKNVVLMFYPAAFTGICTNELCTLRDRTPEFDSEDTVILGVSCDRVPSLKMFAEQEGIEYPLLSDFWPHGEVSRAYGVFLESHGISTRGTFLIDTGGRAPLVGRQRPGRDPRRRRAGGRRGRARGVRLLTPAPIPTCGIGESGVDLGPSWPRGTRDLRGHDPSVASVARALPERP